MVMDVKEKARELVSQMTIEEKASLCSGKDVWTLKGIPRLNLKEEMATDGPNGLRKAVPSENKLEMGVSLPAVCFPSSSAIACSFDRSLWFEIGKAIGEACRSADVGILNGPGINIKRSPLCGRNFEYYSEDPYLTGEAAIAFIDGVQSQGVGVCLKHFAANSQETRRMTVDSVMDERTFREIYLPAFETAVKKTNPWTIMAAFNKLFGEHATENKRLLTDILREEWGFDGVIISDWGAVEDRMKALEAGLDLEMPHMEDTTDKRIACAVESGKLPEDLLDQTAIRMTELILKCAQREPLQVDIAAHRTLAKQAAIASAVLLKNDGELLPGNANQKAAVIGGFAKEPRYQGMGSSRVNPIQVDSAFDELLKAGLQFDYAAGYQMNVHTPDEALIREACDIARDKEIVYIFAGLPGNFEAEGMDRKNIAMPESHVVLIQAVSKVNPNVVVVVHGGAPMELNWADDVPAILLLYLGGEAVGAACADLLLGLANPAGKLAESWPITASDAPTDAYFPGYPLTVEYREGPFVGYRYYDTAEKEVRYPFGYGLSYTEFLYQDLKLSTKKIGPGEPLQVSLKLTNVGKVAGSEVVQLYVSCKNSVIIRAQQELKRFEKVVLQPGESKVIAFTLSERDFAYYNTAIKDWHVEGADYEIRLASSSRDVRLKGEIHFEGDRKEILPDLIEDAPCYYDLKDGFEVSDDEFAALLGRDIPLRERIPGSPYTMDSTLEDIKDTLIGKFLLNMMKKQTEKIFKEDPEYLAMADVGTRSLPLRFLGMMSGGAVTVGQVEGLVELLNKHVLKGLRMLFRPS